MAALKVVVSVGYSVDLMDASWVDWLVATRAAN